MKKMFQSFILLLVGLPIVSAQFYSNNVAEDLIRGAQDVFSPIFEVLLGTSSYDDFFFAKILLFLLLFIVILAVLKRTEIFEKVKKLTPVISFIISLLAIRYISEEGFLTGILLPYGILGIAIIIFLPFLIYFFFVHKSVQSTAGRRLAWILYGIVFGALWISRSSELRSELNWIYFFGIVAVIISFLFDKDINKYFGTARAHKLKRGFVLRRIAHIEADLEKFRSITDPSKGTKAIITRLERRLIELLNEVS